MFGFPIFQRQTTCIRSAGNQPVCGKSNLQQFTQSDEVVHGYIYKQKVGIAEVILKLFFS